MPLNFATLEDEVGFVFVNEALRFGSRYDKLLQQHAKRTKSAKDMFQFGLLGSFISAKSLHLADNMLAICNDPHAIGITFDFPVHQNEALDFAKLGGVYREVDGPLHPFAKQIGRVLNEMGILCRSRGVDCVGGLALGIQPGCKTLNQFATELAKALPITFGGDGLWPCKAIRLGVLLATRFPEQFPFDLSAGVRPLPDPELVFALRKLGALRLGDELQSKVDQSPELVLSAQESDLLRLWAGKVVERMGVSRGDLAGDWVVEKAHQVVSLSIRKHQCESLHF
ncbi:hypothetical protein BASA81_010277 [Batrachochytrium salamandrivorans]|nr:hypothetical protein BASA81_010277 [Batrachochytrium salamandrivorans]